jgi:ubiquinone/menaquinone biosynthesis C-methylase UbiE
MRQKPDYGIDSPGIVTGELIFAGVALAATLALAAFGSPHVFGVPLWPITLVIGAYVALMGLGMLYYSRIGKLRIRDHLLGQLTWRGDERALDVGCGRGLMLVGAARCLTSGAAIGVDAWDRGAITGNGPEAALRNAKLEGVADRAQVREGDARNLPFDDASFDVVVSNFVIHEMDTGEQRERMLREIARVLKPDGQVALVDFIFTAQAARVLRANGVSNAKRAPLGHLGYWSFALVTLGMGQLCQVTGTKDTAPRLTA